MTVLESHEYVAKDVHSTHQKLAGKLHHMKTVIQAIQLQYTALPQPAYQDYGGGGNYGGNINY